VTQQTPDRLDGRWLDTALHLLDRQVVDRDGKMVCNVDDLEITISAGGEVAVTGLLVGPAALVPRLSGRFSGWLRHRWDDLGVQYAHREVPLYIGLDLVDRVGSDVRLRVARDGLLDRQPAAAPGVEQRRLGELLGMDVYDGGQRLGRVQDMRVVPRRTESRLVARSLIVGRGRPGSFLGYERGGVIGPALVRTAVRHLHRHTGELAMDLVEEIDWESSRVAARGPLAALSGA
jgi:sporulation protein YlmC with PRC-barrel domain